MLAAEEKCAEIVEAIDRLIPVEAYVSQPDLVRPPYTRPLPKPEELFTDPEQPRQAQHSVDWQDNSAVVSSQYIPHRWVARILEPYRVLRKDAAMKLVHEVAQVKQPVNLYDRRVGVALFNTSGINAYTAGLDRRQNQINWTIVRTASRNELGIFITSLQFSPDQLCRRQAAAAAGHIKLDKDEQEAQLKSYNGLPSFSAEQKAKDLSWRVTPKGADFLLRVLSYTQVMQEIFEASRRQRGLAAADAQPSPTR